MLNLTDPGTNVTYIYIYHIRIQKRSICMEHPHDIVILNGHKFSWIFYLLFIQRYPEQRGSTSYKKYKGN